MGCRRLLWLASVVVVAATVVGGLAEAAAPLGQVSVFSTGLNTGSSPRSIAAGPDGNLWFIDRGPTKAIGRITPVGRSPSSARAFPAAAPGHRGRAGRQLWFTDGTTAGSGGSRRAARSPSSPAGLTSRRVPLHYSRLRRQPWFTRRGHDQGDRADHAGRRITEFSAGLKAAAPDELPPARTATSGSPTGHARAIGRITRPARSPSSVVAATRPAPTESRPARTAMSGSAIRVTSPRSDGSLRRDDHEFARPERG